MDLAARGLPVIVIPATIGNDMVGTDETIGYDTAMNTVLDAVDKLRDSASSHERCSVVEVMGRHAGFLAYTVGIATGAEVVLIPELELDFKRDVIQKVLSARNRGKHHYIVIVAEGIELDEGFSAEDRDDPATAIARRIQEVTGVESRATILGYVQRGGNPSLRDRYLSSMMGIQAIACLLEGRKNRMISLVDGKVVDLDLNDAMRRTKSITPAQMSKARILTL